VLFDASADAFGLFPAYGMPKGVRSRTIVATLLYRGIRREGVQSAGTRYQKPLGRNYFRIAISAAALVPRKNSSSDAERGIDRE
jgi:hypothetical protein